jgi:hypothetical protein
VHHGRPRTAFRDAAPSYLAAIERHVAARIPPDEMEVVVRALGRVVIPMETTHRR